MNVFQNGIISDPESLVTGGGRERMSAQARPSAETISSGRSCGRGGAIVRKLFRRAERGTSLADNHFQWSLM